MRRGLALAIAALLTGCFSSEGGVIQRADSGGSPDAGLCGATAPCPFGYLCGPTGACVPCTGGPGCLPPDERDAFQAPTLDAGATPDSAPDATPPDAAPNPPPDAAPPPVDMGDPPPDACLAAEETCNETDDDCDGTIDEGFDLMSDPAHCGACGQACPAPPNTEVQCLERQCLVVSCVEGWRDENEVPGDGCEFPVVTLVLGPDMPGLAVRDSVEMTIEVTGVEHVDRITVSVANARLANLEAAESLRAVLDLSGRFEGETLLTVRAYDGDDVILASETLWLIIDRTPPRLRFATPGPMTPITDQPFEVSLEVTDLTGVTAALYVDGILAREFAQRPYETVIDPTAYVSGPHLIRAEATDAAGNTADADVEVSFIFCDDAEMVPIAHLGVSIDPYEASRPDATADAEGENQSLACSRVGVLPWREANYETAVRTCDANGKRLCTQEEWEFACGGAAHRAYPYGGGGPDQRACNGATQPGPERLLPTGDREDCVTPEGVFDLSGNVAEWVDGRFGTGLSGGHYASPDGHLRCDAHQGLNGGVLRPQNGFRCCRDD